MTVTLSTALAHLGPDQPAVLVTVAEALGSTPREAGARMLVTERDIAGTIGGGQLEWRAVEAARELLAEGGTARRLDLPLGPALQQCCGGYVAVTLEAVTPAVRERLAGEIAASLARLPLVALYGAGHVGRAVVTALAPLPCRTLWIDSRADPFPDLLPANAEARHAAEPAAIAATLPPGTFYLVMTHSHPLDLDIVEAVLRRGDFAWLGLIGSDTKRRRFEGQLRARGIPAARLDRLVCPIGIRGIDGKEPAVIAASVAAQLLLAFEAAAAARTTPALEGAA
jgi:xanthine dehydrogenase accessory protein XdhC